MKRAVRSSQVLVVVALALAGVGLGHVGEYLLLAPHHHERHELLARTGHQYLPAALSAAAFAALVAVTLMFLLALGRGMGKLGLRRSPLQWSRAVPAAQVLAFAALEVGERLVSHAPLNDIALVLAVGVPLQLLVGFLAGRLAAEIEQTAERLGERLAGQVLHLRRSGSTSWRPNVSFRPALSPAAVAIPARGPPSVLAA